MDYKVQKIHATKKITYMKIIAYIGIVFINRTLFLLLYALAIASTRNLGVGPPRELVNTLPFL